jgi:hypothetical protein
MVLCGTANAILRALALIVFLGTSASQLVVVDDGASVHVPHQRQQLHVASDRKSMPCPAAPLVKYVTPHAGMPAVAYEIAIDALYASAASFHRQLSAKLSTTVHDACAACPQPRRATIARRTSGSHGTNHAATCGCSTHTCMHEAACSTGGAGDTHSRHCVGRPPALHVTHCIPHSAPCPTALSIDAVEHTGRTRT